MLSGRTPPAPRRRAVALAALGWLLLAAGVSAAGADPTSGETPGRYAGRPLPEALLDLRARGLKIVFASNVVRPEMTVESEPAAVAPRAVLDELLAPHGLEARDGPGGTIVVVPRAGGPAVSQATIHGFVRSRRDSAPVAGVAIQVLETGATVTSRADGSFRIPDLEAGTFTLEVRRRGFVVERLDGVAAVAGRPAELSILLDPAIITEEEIVVTPSRLSLLREEPRAPLALSRDDILALPHLGDDFFRALGLLSGISGNDVTAQFHVRGGRRDETRILLDGQELYETYHLKDFDSALSVVAPTTLEKVDLSTGGFSVEHGDRMSGVLDMTTLTPSGPTRTRIGLGLLNAQVGSTGSFDDQRGSWIAEGRRGSIDLAGRLLGREDPRFWDLFAKLDYQLDPRNGLRLNVLRSDDELEFSETVGDEEKLLQTQYRNAYVWLTHQALVGDTLVFETAVSTSHVDRDRGGFELEEDVQFEIRDERDLDVLALRQDWNLQPGERHYLKWGFELRDFDARYDYRGSREFDNPLALIRENPDLESTVFAGRFDERHDSLYLADRIRIASPLTVELGLRFDRHTLTDESRVSPRLNLVYAVGRRSVLRAAWGRFLQSQRPYELQVEDGDTSFHPVERSEHRVLGFEHLFAAKAGRPDLALRVELYQRRVSNPLPRFENLYEPVSTFPEVEPDRVRVAPERSIAEGIELFLRGRLGPKIGWWVNYAHASTKDQIAGRRVPRRFDQPHSVNLVFDYRPNDRWSLNLAGRYHTGWPTTPLSLRQELDEDGEIVFVPVAGPRFSRRLPVYHRLDLRASRRWRLRGVDVHVFIDAQNVYNRHNVAGFDHEIDDRAGVIVANEERWTGFLPSAGISFEF